LAAQPAAAPPEPPKVSWSGELELSSLAAIDEAMSQPLGDMPSAILEDKSVRSLKTCKDLLSTAKLKFHLSPDNDLAWATLSSEGLRCFALDALRAAKAAANSYLGWFKFSRADIGKLPARFTLGFSEDEEGALVKADKACKPWGKYDPALKVRVKGQKGEADVHANGWTGRLVLYARADLDGDGLEDLMLLREGQAEGGTATSSMLFIVSQTSVKGCPHIVRMMPESLGKGTGP
jgi:hypothetical protein